MSETVVFTLLLLYITRKKSYDQRKREEAGTHSASSCLTDLRSDDQMGYIEEIRSLVGHRPLILVGAIVIATDPQGRILLQQRRHPAGAWGIPGGLMELGESTEEAARREVQEECGLTLGALHLFNVYSGVKHFVMAPNGDAFYAVTVAYCTDEISGVLKIDPKESLDFRFFDLDELPEAIVPRHVMILDEYKKRLRSSD